MLERLALLRSPEQLHPEGNGRLPSVSPMKVPSTVLQRISQRASRKNAVVVTSTQLAHQLLLKAKNRLQVKKEKVMRQVAKKLPSSSALAEALTCPPKETGNGIDPDNTGMSPSMEQDEDEIGEASEVEEGGEEEGEEEQPRKVKIKLPDSKAPSEL